MLIGNKLLELRKMKNMSQEEVADKLNVSRQTVSKWETCQSTPDFDKIVPLCELFEISTEELLTGKKPNDIEPKIVENKKKTVLVLSTSIFLYFISIIWIILAESAGLFNDEIVVSIFLGICAISTVSIIYHFVSMPKVENKKIVESKKYKSIKSILVLIFLIIYFLVSFTTYAWYITWIIWIIYALVREIVKLIFILSGEHYEK